MPFYLLIRCRIHDREAFVRYAQRAAELVQAYGGEYLVRGGRHETLEGDLGDGAFVVSRWPSREAALTFWHSPEYREARTLREGHAEADVVLVPGTV